MDQLTEENHGPEMLTAKEVAQILRIHRSTVYEMISTRQISTVKFGRTVRIRRLDLEKFIQDHIETDL